MNEIDKIYKSFLDIINDLTNHYEISYNEMSDFYKNEIKELNKEIEELTY